MWVLGCVSVWVPQCTHATVRAWRPEDNPQKPASTSSVWLLEAGQVELCSRHPCHSAVLAVPFFFRSSDMPGTSLRLYNSFDLHGYPVTWCCYSSLPAFLRCRNRGTGKFSKLPKVIQVINGRVAFKPKCSLEEELCEKSEVREVFHRNNALSGF